MTSAADAAPTTGLGDLPVDIVRLVMRHLGARSLTCLASTCREYRDLAAALPLHVSLSREIVETRLGRYYATGAYVHHTQQWMKLPHVAPRVRCVTARRTASGACTWLTQLRRLEHLTILFSRVTAAALLNAADTLRHLDVHRLRPTRTSRVFNTAVLGRLRHLRVLRLTFDDDWESVVLQGLLGLRDLQELTLRRAPFLVVNSAPRAERVTLHAELWHSVGGALRPCRSLDVECDMSSVPLGSLLPDDLSGLQSLRVRCPNRSIVPRLRDMTALRALYLDLDALVLDPADLADTLESLEVRVRFALGVAPAGVVPRPPALARLRAELEGALLAGADDLFFLPPPPPPPAASVTTDAPLADKSSGSATESGSAADVGTAVQSVSKPMSHSTHCGLT
jgi:hypothetical protein